MTALPPPRPVEEDAWLADLAQAHPEVVVEAVAEALAARRPQLAARAVGLLPEDADAPGRARARRAARLLLLQPADRRGPVIAELEAAVSEMKDAWMTRARRRQRARIADPHDAQPKPRRPRGHRDPTGRR